VSQLGLYENIALTRAKLTSTMVSCGVTTIRRFHEDAVLVLVSEASIQQNSFEVRLRDPSFESTE